MDPFVGEIKLLPYTFAPLDYVLCDGSLLPVVQYQALFSLLGTVFGGDGKNNFQIPDLRGRIVIGQGTGTNPPLTPRAFAAKFGTTEETLTVNNLPSHNHVLAVNTATATEPNPVTHVPSMDSGSGMYVVNPDQSVLTTMASDAVTAYGSGTGAPHPNMMPYQILGYYIAVSGLYPIRP